LVRLGRSLALPRFVRRGRSLALPRFVRLGGSLALPRFVRRGGSLALPRLVRLGRSFALPRFTGSPLDDSGRGVFRGQKTSLHRALHFALSQFSGGAVGSGGAETGRSFIASRGSSPFADGGCFGRHAVCEPQRARLRLPQNCRSNGIISSTGSRLIRSRIGR
jgi:hypothetical protein